LLVDLEGFLIQQTVNVQSARQVRLVSLAQIVKMERVLKSYVYEAIEVERAGLKVKYKKTSQFKIPDEFQNKLDKTSKLKTAFEALTQGPQRAYIFYLSQPKLSKTRTSRAQKYVKQILNDTGLDD